MNSCQPQKRRILKHLWLALALPASTLPTSALAAQVDCTGVADWDAGAVYQGGDPVVSANKRYHAKWWTTNEDPQTTGQWGVWDYQGDCGTVDPINNPPTVSISSPTSPVTVNVDEVVKVNVLAEDSDNGDSVSKVELLIDNAVFAVDVTAPYEF